MGYEYQFLDIGRRRFDNLKTLDKDFYKDSTVVFVGGGCFCRNWAFLDKEYFDQLQEKFKKIIFLPSTYEDYAGNNLLKNLDQDKFIFFRRDNFESKIAVPNSIFAPDFALYIKEVSFTTSDKR